MPISSHRSAKTSSLAALLLLELACGPSRRGAPASGGASGAGGAGGGSCIPSPSGEQTVSLEGEWTFTPSGAAPTTIDVPGGGWLAQGFHVTAARYARTLTVPVLGPPQATLIELGAVNHQAALSIDGTLIATNTTSFTPSVFDVTTAVMPGADHALTIDVKGRDALRNAANRKLVPGRGWLVAEHSAGDLPVGGGARPARAPRPGRVRAHRRCRAMRSASTSRSPTVAPRQRRVPCRPRCRARAATRCRIRRCLRRR